MKKEKILLDEIYYVYYKNQKIAQLIINATDKTYTYQISYKLNEKSIYSEIPDELKENYKGKENIKILEEIIEERTFGKHTYRYEKENICLQKMYWHNQPEKELIIYNFNASKSSKAYSEKRHDYKSLDNDKETDRREGFFALSYRFVKYNDGIYQSWLDEAFPEGSHYGGGIVKEVIPDQWFDLPYEEFLQKVYELNYVKEYNFSLNDLKNRDDLKDFFGY